MKKNLFIGLIASMFATSVSANVPDTIKRIQHEVNSNISYRSDSNWSDDWKIPTKYGDCEDFALLKKKLLIEAGWPSEDLQLILLYKKDETTSKPVVVGHLTLLIRSQNLILDINDIGGYEPKDYGHYMQKFGWSFRCIIKDESEGIGKKVSDRC